MTDSKSPTDSSALEQTIESLRRLPDAASFDDVLYRVYVLHTLDAGLRDVKKRGELFRTKNLNGMSNRGGSIAIS